MKKFSFFFATFILAVLLISVGFKQLSSKKVETQTVYGTAVTTIGLHNMSCVDCNNAKFEHGCYANSCFSKYTLSVSAPSGWSFNGNPFVNCTRNDQGAFEWNNFAGSPDRFIITQNKPSYIQATVWAGSRSIDINLACAAEKN